MRRYEGPHNLESGYCLRSHGAAPLSGMVGNEPLQTNV